MAKIDRFKVKDTPESKIKDMVEKARKRRNVKSCDYVRDGDEWVVTTVETLGT